MTYPNRGVWDIDFAAEQAKPKLADLAADVLDAMTRKLRDYDRLAAALTSAQEAATRNLERARLAEDERNTYRASLESYDADVDRLGDELRELKGRLAAATKDRDTLSMQAKGLCRSIDKLRKERDDYQAAAEAEAEEVDRRGALLHSLLTFVRERRKGHELRRKAGLFGGDNIIDAEIHELREMNRALCDKVEQLCSGVRSPRRRHEKLKAEAINGDCAIGTPKPRPTLTPLRVVHCQSDGYAPWCMRFSNGIELERSTPDRVNVERWKLKLRALCGHVYSATYPQSVHMSVALADVNAILARYGYVLEAWP